MVFLKIFIFCLLSSLFLSQNDTKLNCTNCFNTVDSKNSENVINSINCTNCYNCSDVKNCFNCTDVHNSTNVSHSLHVINSTNVTNSINIFNSKNIANSESCESCLNCFSCNQCTDCVGYYCQNEEKCRNSKWKYRYWEPAQDDANAWKCNNKLINDYNFNKAGYSKPEFLVEAQKSSDLAFCNLFNGNRSCCNKKTTEQIRDIFKDYKQTLQLRASKKIETLKNAFEQYKQIDLSKIPDRKAEIQQGIIEQMRQTKVGIYNIAKSMATCGKTILNFVAGMLCLGCMPDWQWQRYLLVNDTSSSMSKEEFDPEKPLKFLFDLEKEPLQTSVFIGRQICEDLYSNCKSIMESFNSFSNYSAKYIGGFADEITNNQWVYDSFNESRKLEIRKQAAEEIKKLSERNVIWINVHGDKNYSVDINAEPPYEPTDSQKKMSLFKQSLRSLGFEYPYDPVNYYNFNPSINFEDPVAMTDEMCRLMTGAANCVFCFDESDNWIQEKESCFKLKESDTNSVYKNIQEETNRQYRDFSAFFFQVKIVVLDYIKSPNDLTQNITRHFLFPPFREGEIYLELETKTWEEKRLYFKQLEDNITYQYDIFQKTKESQDDFRIWNDEYWMNFIYQPAMDQGREFYRALSQKYNFGLNYKFQCELSGECILCESITDGRCEKMTGYKPYCEDCHFSNVRIEANCANKGCITCLYIGGGTLPYEDTDEDELDSLDDDPMDKCYIRADHPFYDTIYSDKQFYPKFYRESDAEKYKKMEDLFDLRDEKDKPWNIAKIGEWFYKIKGSEYYSVVNVMSIDKDTIIVPNTTNVTHYDYIIPCGLDNPINQCKKWNCDFLVQGFFPEYKIIYDPQDRNDAEFASDYANTTAFNLDLVKYPGQINSAWNISYGRPDPNENYSYYDVAYWGIGMVNDGDLQLSIGNINENTDIIRFVEADEKDVFSINIIFKVIYLAILMFVIY